MIEKSLSILEYPQVLERLSGFCAFDVSVDLARSLQPVTELVEGRRLLEETSEAVFVFAKNPNFSIGGARDVREQVTLASNGGVLEPADLLDIKSTLVAARTLSRSITNLEGNLPHLTDLVLQLSPPSGIIEIVTKAISDKGEILDTASENLRAIRRDINISHERLLNKLQHMVADPKITPYLQEGIITQRDGRYVLPIKSEFKGRVKSIVHDQSASGATLFVEPLSVVNLNNRYRELLLEERDEERRILEEISYQVGSQGEEIIHTMEVVARFDLALARARYALEINGVEPKLSDQLSSVHQSPQSVIRLYDARHPLLDPEKVVPIDVEMTSPNYALVITGPNTGGKTVTLKTVGLLSLMAQSGLYIPASGGSEISIFEAVYADIGDEQSIEQSLSTFSSHITNIIHILENASGKTLVLLDELGAGTDPQEGAALGSAILNHLIARGVPSLVTTHHPELKVFAHVTPGVLNASVDFDLDTLQPTYRLNIGLPGRSNALAIADRLGMPSEIIEAARATVDPESLLADGMIDDILHQRILANQAREAAETAREEADSALKELRHRLENIDQIRNELLEESLGDTEVEIDEIRAEIRTVRHELSLARLPLEEIKKLNERIGEVEEEIEGVKESEFAPTDLPLSRPIQTGDTVRLRKLDTSGVVADLDGEQAQVQIGQMRIRVQLLDLELALTDEIKENANSGSNIPTEDYSQRMSNVGSLGSKVDLFRHSPGIELNLRGQQADEALESMERYLDAAYLAGMPFARIIHGKGTGKLRKVVRSALKQHPHVESFEVGGHTEGGDGVTVVKFAG